MAGEILPHNKGVSSLRDLERVILLPTGLKLFSRNAAFGSFLLFEQVLMSKKIARLLGAPLKDSNLSEGT